MGGRGIRSLLAFLEEGGLFLGKIPWEGEAGIGVVFGHLFFFSLEGRLSPCCFLVW